MAASARSRHHPGVTQRREAAISRLRVQHPELADALATVPEHRLRGVLQRLCDESLSATGLAISDEERSVDSLTTLVERLDEEAFDINDAVEEGRRSGDEYKRAFARARAANALLYLVSGGSQEVVYETLAALDADEGRVGEMIAAANT